MVEHDESTANESDDVATTGEQDDDDESDADSETDDDDESDADSGTDHDAPPDGIPRDWFLVWRAPRVALRNPQRMTNPVWAWLARRQELSAYSANAKFAGPSSMEVGPGWCGNRYGRSETTLPDGRVIEVGGEHEDYYDPDFYIYNDVIVKHPSGELEIYGYPHDVFPPTDFHSATAVGEKIVIIGCLGYPWMRAPGQTPVFSLDTRTFVISRVTTTGEVPGWIHEHTAELAGESSVIVVRKGKRTVWRDGELDLVENIDDWSLDLASGIWTRLTDRRWPRYELARADGKSNELFEIESAAWYAEGTSEFHHQQLASLEQRLGRLPDFALYATRYCPPVPHVTIPAEAFDVTRIAVEEVQVRYHEDMAAVQVVVEGSLPAETVAAIVEDARRKLEELERTPYVAREVTG